MIDRIVDINKMVIDSIKDKNGRYVREIIEEWGFCTEELLIMKWIEYVRGN